MQCPKCGATLRATAIYCNRCGRRLVPRLDTGGQPMSGGALPVQTTDVDFAAVETQELAFGMALPAAEPFAPLAMGALIAERYRIDRMLATLPDEHRYLVTDLWDGTRCWECGAIWSEGDDFCEHCGAARRGALLIMREQRLTPEIFAAISYADAMGIVDGDRVYVVEGEPVAEQLEREPAYQAEPVAASNETVATEPPAVMMPMPDTSSATMELPIPEPPAPPSPGPDALAEMATASLAALGSAEQDPPTIDLDPFAAPNFQNEAPTIEAMFFTPSAPSVQAPNALLTVQIGMASDVGHARSGKPNEDTAVIMSLVHGGDAIPAALSLCVVADGLGGHEDGQRAGRLAARLIATHVLQTLWLPALDGLNAPEYDPVQLGEALRGGILEANNRILAANVLEGGDMGCTVTAFIAQGNAACIANVGDSRTYHFNGNALERVTQDHSLVARMVAAKMLDAEEIYSHPQRSQIYRSLGDEADLKVDLFPRRLEPGDVFVLCSDGLWEMVRDPTIANLLQQHQASSAQMLARQLVNTANDHGGDDNVTVIVAKVN